MPKRIDRFRAVQLKTISEFLALSAKTAKNIPLAGLLAKPLAALDASVQLAQKLLDINDPEDLGQIAMTLAFERTAVQALEEVGEPQERIPLAWTQQEAQKQVATADLAHEETLRGLSLDNPLPHAFVRHANRGFRKVAQSTGYSEAEWRNIQACFRREFQANLTAILSDRELAPRFKPFKDWLKDGTKAHNVYAVLDRHAERQRRLFEEAQVFQVEPFSLRQVYVDTDCGVLEWKQIRPPAGMGRTAEAKERLDAFAEKNGGRHPLLDTTLDLIGDPKYDDAIVIQGAAGSGKSSFTRRLCSCLLEEGLRPIRVRIRDLQLDGPLLDDLQQAILNDREIDPEQDEEDYGPKPEDLFLGGSLFDESVKFGAARISPFVVILDGWDEVLSTNEGFTKRVERMLQRVRNELLRRNNPKVRVILTGRPSDAVGDSGFLKEKTKILTIRPYSQEQLSGYFTKLCDAVRDPVSPQGADRWGDIDEQRFQQATDSYAPDMSRLEILGLPLLAHLAALALTAHQGDIQELVRSPTTLYRSLADLTTANAGKGADDQESTEGLYMFREGELRRLLHLTAIAITAHGLENIPFEELERRLQLLGYQGDLEEDAGAAAQDPLTRLLVSYYFKGGLKDLGCEFLHKSFREYLFAEAIVEILKDYGRQQESTPPERPIDQAMRDFDPNVDLRYDLSRKLATALCAQWLTLEVKRHLHGLLEWEFQQSGEGQGGPDNALDPAGWGRVRDALADLWEWWGEGVHLRPHKRKGRKKTEEEGPLALALELVKWSAQLAPQAEAENYPRLVTPDGHLGDALCELIAAVHRQCATASAPVGAARRYQALRELDDSASLAFAPGGRGLEEGRSYLSEYMARINAVGWRPRGDFPSNSDLRGADLAGAYFPGANLEGANLQGATLSFVEINQGSYELASLCGAYLFKANLCGANLDLADLSGADLSSARLTNARLMSANLLGTILAGTDLRSADLRHANMRGANLTGADLTGADLTGADLTGADLTGADLTGAKFTDANLTSAKFGGANFVGADLTSVRPRKSI